MFRAKIATHRFLREGTGRVTLFGAQSNARTFNYEASLAAPLTSLPSGTDVCRRAPSLVTSATCLLRSATTSRTRATRRCTSSRSSTRTASRTSAWLRWVSFAFGCLFLVTSGSRPLGCGVLVRLVAERGEEEVNSDYDAMRRSVPATPMMALCCVTGMCSTLHLIL